MSEEKKRTFEDIVKENIPVHQLSDKDIEIMADKARSELSENKK
jgi:hypothetical protein